MSMEKRARLDRIDIEPDGTLLLRMQKEVVVDGEVVARQPHRTSINPIMDNAKQFAAVNSHLATLGYGAMSADDMGLVDEVTARKQTEPVQQAYREKMAAAVEAGKPVRVESTPKP